jgi:hypothetical protein
MHPGNDEERVVRRELDPTFTRGYVHIPDLRAKLKWLYTLHPTVNTQYKLAGALRVSTAQLSTWLNGVRHTDARTTAAVNPDSIPIKHFQNFLDIWAIPSELLEITDTNEFKHKVQQFEGGRGAWDKLVRAVPDDDTAIEITPESAARGLIDPDEEEDVGLTRFPVGERIMLRVAAPGFAHGMLLEQDHGGWASLRPSSRWPQTDIAGELIFPRQLPDEPPRFARIEGVGVHRILALLTTDALEPPLLDLLLRRPIDVSSLNYTAIVLDQRRTKAPGTCRLVSRRFFASPSA